MFMRAIREDLELDLENEEGLARHGLLRKK